MSEPAWWQRGAIYQIYPRSFADSDGDGVGDLEGHHRAPRLSAGARTSRRSGCRRSSRRRWPTSATTSPTTATSTRSSARCDDLDELIAACHARDIKVVLDWVPNHTSDRHPWFVESRSSRDNPKRDWYVWRDEPNDWVSQFKAVGPAWTFDDATGQYYLHSFMAEQPDLNWDNPEVEAAMHDVLRFWMDRGVDGLRLDAIHKIAKDPLLRDHTSAARRHDEDWESIHDAPARHPQGRRRIRRPDDRGGGGAAGPAPRRRPTSGPATSCTSRTTSSSSTRSGTRRPTRRRSPTSRRSPTGPPGRPGFSATTTTRGPPAASTTTASARSAPARSW